jgi:predicted PurR-regulated permease PerM
MEKNPAPVSPRWGSMTKLVISLTLVVCLGALLVRFKFVIAPVLMAFFLAYILFPLASQFSRKTPLSWAMAVNFIYIVIILVLLTLLTWGGVGLVGQVQNLITAIQHYATELPGIIEDLSHKVFTIGPFHLDLSTIDWQTIGKQVLSYVEPALGKIGGLVGSLASGAATTLGWLAFVVVVSYFFLLESGGLRTRIIKMEIPGYAEDMRRLSQRLGNIWNAYLRGQIIIFISKVIVYSIVLSIMGVHYAIVLAFIAGFSSFLPYVGPAINWIVLGLITFFQGSNPFGLAPLAYTIITIVVALIIDQIFDNLVAPRVMADNLKVHPAFVLIAAIIAANLIGLVGVIIAAPLLATLQLISRYIFRKMLDRDPWPPEENAPRTKPLPKWIRKLRLWWRKRFGKASEPARDETPALNGSPKDK